LGFSISEQDNPFLDFARVLPATSMGMSVRPAGESAQPSTPLAATDISTEPVPGWAGPLLDAAADDALIAAPEAASEPAGRDAATGGEVADAPTDEVARLIARAKLAMSKNRLTLPEQGSAYSYYQRALKLDADNERVQAGIDEIVSRYGELAGTALAEKDFDKARQYVGRALRIDPDDPATLVMRDRVDEAVAQAESEALAAAELARMAAEAPPPPPAAPKPNNRNSLQRLMQFVDGHVFGSNQ